MHKRKTKIDYVSLEDENTHLIDNNFTVSGEDRIDEKILYGMLSEMPEKYITVFNLYIIDGYSHPEIAEKLNISESSSRVLLHRGRVWAMKQLKLHFKDSITKFNKAL